MHMREKILNLQASTSANVHRRVLEDRKRMAEKKSTERAGRVTRSKYKVKLPEGEERGEESFDGQIYKNENKTKKNDGKGKTKIQEIIVQGASS